MGYDDNECWTCYSNGWGNNNATDEDGEIQYGYLCLVCLERGDAPTLRQVGCLSRFYVTADEKCDQCGISSRIAYRVPLCDDHNELDPHQAVLTDSASAVKRLQEYVDIEYRYLVKHHSEDLERDLMLAAIRKANGFVPPSVVASMVENSIEAERRKLAESPQ